MSKYNRENFLIAKAASDEETRYASLRVNPKSTVATDGHMVIQVTAAEMDKGRTLKRPVNLDAKTAKRIAGDIPSHKKAIEQKLEETVEVRGSSTRSVVAIENGSGCLVYTQKDSVASFPGYNNDKVFPTSPAKFRIIVNPQKLAILFGIISEFCESSYTEMTEIEFRDSGRQLLFYASNGKGQHLRAALMPMRPCGEEFAQAHKVEWD